MSRVGIVLAIVCGVLAPSAARACSVCFGAAGDSPAAAGLNVGILLLLGLAGAVQGVIVAFLLRVHRRGRLVEAGEESA